MGEPIIYHPFFSSRIIGGRDKGLLERGRGANETKKKVCKKHNIHVHCKKNGKQSF